MPQPPARRPPLTRAQVLESALQLMDEGGVEALTMRRLAARLNVEAMSLYNHVKDKRDLLEGAANLALSRIPMPAPTMKWRQRIEALVVGLYDALLVRPQLLPLIAREEVAPTDPAVMALLECAAAALAESGLPPALQVSAFRGLIALCFGFVLAHTRGLSASKDQAEAVWAQWDSGQWQGSAVPHLARLAPQFLQTHADDDLRFTLRVYLDALESASSSGAS